MKDSVVDIMVRHHYTLTSKLFAKEKTISELGFEIPIDKVNAYLRENRKLFYIALLERSKKATIMYSYNDIESLPPMLEAARALGVMKEYESLPCFVDVTGRIIQDMWLGDVFEIYCPEIRITPKFPKIPEEHQPEAKYLYLHIGRHTGSMNEREKTLIITNLFTEGVVVRPSSPSSSTLRKLMLKLKGKKWVVYTREYENLKYFANTSYLKRLRKAPLKIIDKNLEK